MSRKFSERLDPTTPEEIFALAKCLHAAVELGPIFERAGLHKPFEQEDRAPINDRIAECAPELIGRSCALCNTGLAEALARRLFANHMVLDKDAIAFIVDRILNDPLSRYDRTITTQETKDILRNLLSSPFYSRFKKLKASPSEVLSGHVELYEGRESFILEQCNIYGISGRSVQNAQLVMTSFLRLLWFGQIPDLEETTVNNLLAAPALLNLGADDLPRSE